MQRLRKSVTALFAYGQREAKTRVAESMLKQRQLELYGPALLALWQQKLAARLRIRSMTLTADGFDNERLSRKAFNCLLS